MDGQVAGRPSSSGKLGAVQLCAVLCLGAAVRLWGLGRESIWLDEATSLIIARMNLRSVIEWAAADVHPPLYYALLHFWLPLGDSESVVRALSVFLGTITLGVQYALARDWFGARVALLATLLLALSPLHVWYSQEVRMYVMVTLLCLLACHLLLQALDCTNAGSGKLAWQARKYWLGYIVTATLALYTHYFALWSLLFANLYAISCLWRRAWMHWRRWLVAQVIVALLFLPWVPILYHQVTTGGGGWVERSLGRPTWYALVDTWLNFSIGLDGSLYPPLLRRLAYGVFALCLLIAVWRSVAPKTAQQDDRARHTRHALTFLLINCPLPLLAVWLASQLKPMYSVRYLVVFLPYYCMLVAVGLAGAPWRGTRWLGIIILSITAMIGIGANYQALQNPDWRGVSALVHQNAQEGDVALFSPRWNQKPFEYYNRGRVPTNMDLPIPVTAEAASRVVSEISERYGRVWLIWQEGHYSDPLGFAHALLQSRNAPVYEWSFSGVNRVILYELERSP